MFEEIVPYDVFDAVNRPMKFITYGDTDSMYINIPSLKPKSTEEAIENANQISSEINSIIIEYNKKYLMPKLGVSENQCYTNFDTEIVCDRFLLLDVKKRYAYREIANKGKVLSKPKIKYTGIPVVRTDYAELTKQFIRRIVEETSMNQIEKSKIITKLNDIAKDIMSQIQNCIANFEFKPIAIPCKWSTGYKTEPHQVIAMRLYNTIADENIFTPISSAQYVPITITNPGQFDMTINSLKNKHENYLNDVPISKINHLAIPYGYDKEKIKAIMKKLNITVDVDKVWSIIYNTDCQRIISAIKQSVEL
jgi:DNA polymerase elongation subunit (family B)